MTLTVGNMKGIAVAVLCVLVAVESRYTGVSTSSAATLGENPWFVHLRVATATSGLLRTCAGSLVSSNFVLTSASCVNQSRFIWQRYGVVNVINPSLVTESNNVVVNPNYNAATGANDIALINVNRVVQSTDNIAPVQLAADGSEVPSSGKFCSFGANEDGSPGDSLKCSEFESLDALSATDFDSGAPLVVDGVQYGVVSRAGGNTNVINVSDYLPWIQQVTGLRSADDDGHRVLVVDE